MFKLATYINLLTHYAKGTLLLYLSASNKYKSTDSNLSLTVLVHYRLKKLLA